tara:strand:+ start:381 stop:764 length:384 start_codon:yes stop_codon:yes gene_type:complete
MEGINGAFFKMKPARLNKSQSQAIKSVINADGFGKHETIHTVIDSIAKKGYFARVDHEDVDIGFNFPYYIKRLNKLIQPLGFYLLPNRMPIPPNFRLSNFGDGKYIYYTIYKTSDYSKLLVESAVHL